MDNDTNRDRAIADAVAHIEFIKRAELPDGDLLVIEEALGMAYDMGAETGIVDLRSADEMAQSLSVSKAWLLRYAKRHDLGHVIGNQRMFTPADMIRILQRRTVPGPVPQKESTVEQAD